MHYYPQLFDVFLLWNRLIIYKGIQLITYIRLMFHMSNTSLFNLEKFSSTDDWVDRKENGMHGMVWPEPEQVICLFFFLFVMCCVFLFLLHVRSVSEYVRKQHETVHFQDMQDHQQHKCVRDRMYCQWHCHWKPSTFNSVLIKLHSIVHQIEVNLTYSW